MTYIDVLEAIAGKIAALWPDRMLYRDFCPTDHQRPSGFLYVQEAGYTDANLGLVRWMFQAELELFAATDAYDVESTEQLRKDQAAVLDQFGGPGLQVGDRFLLLQVTAETPGAGTAYGAFSASWMDSRPGYQDPEMATEPKMEHFVFRVNGKD